MPLLAVAARSLLVRFGFLRKLLLDLLLDLFRRYTSLLTATAETHSDTTMESLVLPGLLCASVLFYHFSEVQARRRDTVDADRAKAATEDAVTVEPRLLGVGRSQAARALRSPPSSLALSPPVIPRVIVFDFDLTLVRQSIATLNVQAMSHSERAAIFIDAPFLRSFCAAALRQHHVLRIASHADDRVGGESAGDVMVTLLDAAIGPKRRFLVDPAHTACWRSKSTGKNGHIKRIIESTHLSGEGLFQTYQVVLIDDQEGNIRKANGEGFHGFHCPAGFSREWFNTQVHLQEILSIYSEDV